MRQNIYQQSGLIQREDYESRVMRKSEQGDKRKLRVELRKNHGRDRMAEEDVARVCER